MKEEKEQTSKDLSGGDQGSITLLLCLLLTTLTLFIMLSAKKLLLLNEERQQRTQTYLCLKEVMDEYSSLQKFIKKTNLSIIALNTAMATLNNPALQTMKLVVQRTQDIRILLLSRKILSSQCKGLQLKILKDAYPLKGFFPKARRSFFGTILLRKRARKLFLASRKSYPFFFILKGDIRFTPSLKLYNSRELFIGPKVIF